MSQHWRKFSFLSFYFWSWIGELRAINNYYISVLLWIFFSLLLGLPLPHLPHPYNCDTINSILHMSMARVNPLKLWNIQTTIREHLSSRERWQAPTWLKRNQKKPQFSGSFLIMTEHTLTLHKNVTLYHCIKFIRLFHIVHISEENACLWQQMRVNEKRVTHILLFWKWKS